ncbi:MAG: ABC transporter substrate-binding protein [Chitinophagaceae bacterium]|jgi:hypothetical protein|nr:ABC transporter substrate-binding protein [Chitinophagaceae bacterium]
MRAGVLYPASKQYPAGGIQFCDAIKKATSKGEIALSWEPVDHGGLEEVVAKAAEKLLIAHDVEVLVAFLDYRVLENLSALAANLHKPLLIVNPGANHPLHWQKPAGYNVSFLTLQQAFSCYLLGSHAAQVPPTALMGMLYDAGYLQAYALDRGVQEHGGSVAGHYYSKDSGLRPLNDASAIGQFLQAANPGSVGLLADAESGYFFCKAIADAGYQHNVFGSPMVAEWSTPTAGWPFAIEVCTAFSVQIPAHAEWCRQKEVAETPFGVLGYEAGLWLNAEWQRRQNKVDLTVTNLAGCLQNATLYWDAATHHYKRPQYRLGLQPLATDWLIEHMANHEAAWQQFTNVVINTPVSGWTNTYLCY